MKIVLGIILIILGLFIIKYYEELNNKRGLSFKIRTGGISFIIIGIGLILDELGII